LQPHSAHDRKYWEFSEFRGVSVGYMPQLAEIRIFGDCQALGSIRFQLGACIEQKEIIILYIYIEII
jgi:hypothetical protein